MKVLVVIPQYVAKKVGDRYFDTTLVSHLERYGMLGEITLCSQVENQSTDGGHPELSGIKVIKIHKINSVKTLLAYSKSNKKAIKEGVKRADLIIAYVPSMMSNYALKCAKRLGKKTLLVGISCPWDAFWNHSTKGKVMAPIATFAMKRAFGNTDYALYVTKEFLQRRYPSKGLTAGISDVVLQETDSTVLENRLNKIRNSDFSNTNREIKLITCAAVYVRYKRQEDVIRAVSILKDKYNLHYYLAGRGDQSHLRKVAEACGVEDRVHFLGALSHDYIFSTLHDMDIYIQPSKQEGLPRALVEAMSQALPAIGSNVGGIPELLTHKYIFEKGNVNDICKHIEMMLHKDVLIESAKENFDKAKCFDAATLNEERRVFFENIKRDMRK